MVGVEHIVGIHIADFLDGFTHYLLDAELALVVISPPTTTLLFTKVSQATRLNLPWAKQASLAGIGNCGYFVGMAFADRLRRENIILPMIPNRIAEAPRTCSFINAS